MPICLPRSAGSSAAKHINENTAGWTITITSWGLRDENNTENRGGSTATTSWVVPGHHGANAQQHIDENNTENVSGSIATTSWVVQASEHTADAGQQPLAPLLDVVRVPSQSRPYTNRPGPLSPLQSCPLANATLTMRSAPAAPSYRRPCKRRVGYRVLWRR